jgi:phosphoribosylformylglycinamidine synthase I
VKLAVIRFPGSNCDQDALHAVRDDVGIEADYVWHEDTSLAGFDAVFVPGGFSYGDYLRCGAMAARAPIMAEVRRLAENGNPVIGACNGFQVLTEAQLLPGALLLNQSEKFVCQNVFLKAENRSSIWTSGVEKIITIPIAHGEGRYICDDDTLKAIQDNQQIAFLYVDASGNPTPYANPNGSTANIAGVLNATGNVLGLMPHPERATKAILSSTDGLMILRALSMVNT